MKVRNRKDSSEEGVKKITLIDGFSINSSYNFFIDMNDKEIYTVYATVKKFDDPKTPAIKPIQKVDIRNEKIFNLLLFLPF